MERAAFIFGIRIFVPERGGSRFDCNDSPEGHNLYRTEVVHESLIYCVLHVLSFIYISLLLYICYSIMLNSFERIFFLKSLHCVFLRPCLWNNKMQVLRLKKDQ